MAVSGSVKYCEIDGANAKRATKAVVQLAIRQQSIAPPQSPPQRLGASIVLLVMVLVFSMGLLVVKSGFTSIAWVIAALVSLVLGLWRYLNPEPKGGERVDYFPSVIV